MLPNPTNSILSAWSGYFSRNFTPQSCTHLCRSGWPQGIQNVTTFAPAGIVGVGAVGVPPETPPAAGAFSAGLAGSAGFGVSAGLAAAAWVGAGAAGVGDAAGAVDWPQAARSARPASPTPPRRILRRDS